MPPSRSGVSMPTFTATQELFRADGLSITTSSDTVTGTVRNQVSNATTGLIDVSSISNGLLIVSVGTVTGTTPTLALFFDVQDAYGNWVQVSGATSITPAVITTAGVYTGNVSTGDLLAFNGRLRWTVTGTTPVFPGVSLNLYGR
jgi:hypothetical protein